MKNKIFLCLILVLLVSGCGNTKLNCSKTEKRTNMTDNYDQEIIFKDDKMKLITQTIKFVSDQNLDEEYKLLKDDEKNYQSKEGIVFEVSKLEDGILVSLEIETSKAKQKDLDEFGFDEETLKWNVDKVSEKMKGEGFTCK